MGVRNAICLPLPTINEQLKQNSNEFGKCVLSHKLTNQFKEDS